MLSKCPISDPYYHSFTSTLTNGNRSPRWLYKKNKVQESYLAFKLLRDVSCCCPFQSRAKPALSSCSPWLTSVPRPQYKHAEISITAMHNFKLKHSIFGDKRIQKTAEDNHQEMACLQIFTSKQQGRLCGLAVWRSFSLMAAQGEPLFKPFWYVMLLRTYAYSLQPCSSINPPGVFPTFPRRAP